MTYFSTLQPAQPFLLQNAARRDFFQMWPLDVFEFETPVLGPFTIYFRLKIFEVILFEVKNADPKEVQVATEILTNVFRLAKKRSKRFFSFIEMFSLRFPNPDCKHKTTFCNNTSLNLFN